MSPYLISVSGTRQEVKNLRWLRDHVSTFSVSEGLYGYEATLRAYLDDGRELVAQFVSARILHNWLDRPAFRGQPVVWFGQPRKVGSRDYLDLDLND